ncbi:MAG TPA: trypsin-like peptidase domain-containing protein [Candidatus Limnocylindrales bacterium]|nr:trypsin-like peptidase domain-containing protein [Candidatus Limnocylindrales bacterium]
MTYLLDEPPSPAPEPGPAPTPAGRGEPPDARRTRASRTARRAAPILLGAGLMLVGILAWSALQPKTPPLTSADVRDAIESALASVTPPPARGEGIYAAVRPSLVLIESEGSDPDVRTDDGQGTGVVITGAAEILTALHVVENAETIKVRFADGSSSEAVIESADEENDIAVLQPITPPTIVVPAVLGNPASLRIGSDAFVVGNPFGLYGSMSSGVVSGLERSFRDPKTEIVHTGLIQVDAAVNPGNSGGPLLDREGRVVGIVTALINPTEQHVFIGIGLAVPIDVAGGAAGLPNY